MRVHDKHTSESSQRIRSASTRSRLLTLVTLFALAVVVTVWLVERQHYAQKLEEQIVQLDELKGATQEVDTSSVIDSAFISNRIYSELNELDDAKFAQRRESQLIHNVLTLWQASDNVHERNQKTVVLHHAVWSLDLLRVETSSELALRIKEAGFVEDYKNTMLDQDDQLNEDFNDFIGLCASFRKYKQLRSVVDPTDEQRLQLTEVSLRLVELDLLARDELLQLEMGMELIDTNMDQRKSAILNRIDAIKAKRE